MTKNRANSQLWQTRAAAWELMALSFRYPDAELAQAVANGEWAEAAAEIAKALGTDDPAPAPASAPDPAAPDPAAPDPAAPAPAAAFLHELRTEATRLFVGAPEPAASPYEGVWRARAEGVQALLFVNPHSMDVERFMRSCGLGRPAGTNEPLDHVASECELLEHLALRAAGAAPVEGAPAEDALPGGSAAAAYERFLEEHARTWMPELAAAVEQQSSQPFYRAAARYLGALAGGGSPA